MSEYQNYIQLESLADIIMGQSPDSENCNTDERGLPFLQGCAEFGKQSPFTGIYCSPPLRASKPDSILISVRAPVGKLNWGEQSYCIGRGLGAIKAKPDLSDTRFLGYSIQQNVAFLHRRSQGSTFLAIGANDLKIFPIPVILYESQKKISSIVLTIDQTIEKTEALIEKYQHIKAGLMHDLFTRGIGADGKLRPPREQALELYQQTTIGWIPKEWNLVKSSNFISGIDAGKSPECPDMPASADQWGVLKVSAVSPDGFRELENKVVEKIEYQNPNFIVKSGDLLITRANTPELSGDDLLC